MKLSFSTIGCPAYAWTDIYPMAKDLGFDGADDDDDDATYAPVHYLEDKRYDPAIQMENADWSDSSTQQLQEGLAQLDERSRDILYQRWLAEEKATLHELAAKYQVSAERIRQLEKNAMNKLKKQIDMGDVA